MSQNCTTFCPNCPVKVYKAIGSIGPCHSDFMIVGEGPSMDDVRTGVPFQGRNGRHLDTMLQLANIEKDSLYITNSSSCFPKVDMQKHGHFGDDYKTIISKLKHVSMVACRSRLIDEVLTVKPKVIVALGALAMKSLLDIPEGIQAMRGSANWTTLPLDPFSEKEPHSCWVIPSLHPAFLLRGKEHLSPVVIKDLAKAKAILDGQKPREEDIIMCMRNNPNACQRGLRILDEWIARKATVAIDVETTGPSPIEDKLRTTAIAAVDEHIAVVFPYLGQLPKELEAEFLERTKRICGDEKMHTVFQNLGFDCTAMDMAGMPVKGPVHDTLVMHHVGEPEQPHGLDWQAQSYFIVPAWKAEERRLVKRGEDTLKTLMHYNGRDALYTGWLVEPLREAVSESHGNLAVEKETEWAQLARHMSIVGVPVNMATMDKFEADLISQRDAAMAAIQAKMDWPELDLKKPSHRVEFLYERLALPVTKYTEKTLQPSTSYKAVIDHMHHPMVARYVDWVDKAHQLSTFIKGFRKRISPDGRLRVSWNPTGTVGSRWSSTPNCFDGETEILTEQGFVRFDTLERELRSGTKVAQWDNGSISYVQPDRYIERPHVGTMIHIDSEAVSLCTTPDHRILLQSGRQNVNMTTTAERLSRSVPTRSKLYQHAVDYPYDNVRPRDAEIVVLCACQADGWLRFYNPNTAWELRFTKTRKADRLRAALKELGSAAVWHEARIRRNDGRKEVVFYIKESTTKEFVDAHLQTKQKTFVRDVILRWHPDALSQLVSEVHNWDGRYSRQTEYATTNKENADTIQIASFLTGRCGNVREFWGTKSKKPCYVVQRGRASGMAGIRDKNVTRELGYDGRVYCVSVPSSYIVVRRKGRVVVVGQCQNVPKNLRAMFEPKPGRIFVGADYAALEFRILACFSGCTPLLEAIKNGIDIHSLNASKILKEAWEKLDDKRKLIMRTLIKRVVYGLNYGAEAEKLTQVLREDRRSSVELRRLITLSRVQGIRKGFFELYPEIAQYQQDQVEFANDNGYIEVPPLGRRRYFGALPVQPTKAYNFKIQTAAGDIMNLAMLKLDSMLPETADLLINGHDAVVVECDEKDAESIAKMVEEAMYFHLEYGDHEVELVAEAEIGRTWKDV